MKRILCLFLLCILAGSLLISPLFRTASAQRRAVPQFQVAMPESALRQIQSLLIEKESRTAEQKKMDPQLIYAAKQQRGEWITTEVQSLTVDVKTDDADRALVDISANVTDQLISSIGEAGGEIVYSSEQSGRIRAYVPHAELEKLANSDDVSFIEPAVEATTYRIRQEGLEDSRQNVGTVTSGGDIAHRASEGRIFFGINGRGVKIGVLSDSVRFLEQSQASGDLPPDVTVVPGEGGTTGIPGAPFIGEGTAMLEIIHDLAPGAKLFFATAFRSDASFAANIRRLRFEFGCDILVDDVQYYNEVPFQDGIIAQAVNDVIADGALYFSAAGNNGNLNDGSSGTWEGDFLSGGVLPTLPSIRNYTVHDFGAGNISNRLVIGGFPTVLYWSDPLGGSANDYDLFLLNPTMTQVLGAATRVQDGNDDPFEMSGTVPPGSRLVIARAGNAQPRALHLQVYGGHLAVETDGATYGHSAAAGSFSVAAVNVAVAGMGPFRGGPTNPVEVFSSDGPRRVFFRPDGTPITPDNMLFSTNGGEVRLKPDLTAADGVATTVPVPGLTTFSGTSAAAPHAAAIAALVKSAAPSLTPAEIRTLLTSTALDIEAPGVDRDSGAGIITAFAALEASGAQPEPFLALGRVDVIPAEGDGDTLIEPGEVGILNVQLANIGGAVARDLSAKLTTSTPGVRIVISNSTYPEIPASGTGTNRLPFVFELDRSAPCGLVINFSLTVSYTGKSSPQVFNYNLTTPIDLIVNVGFETGNFNGWTKTVLTPSFGDFFVVSGRTLPISGLSTVGPRSGMFYGVDDQSGPGTHVLLQGFTVPASSIKWVLSFDLFANNYFTSTIVNPIGLDHRATPNQHARVDLLRAGATPFDTGGGVLRNFFLGADAGNNPHQYTHYEFDITEQVGAGGTFQLRFAVSNNQYYFNLGVDNVSLAGASCDAPTLSTSVAKQQRR
jgi:Subtilase family